MFVSAHKEVREALVQAGIPFTVVHPSLEMKDEYIGRYIARGNAPEFVQLLEENYEKWITDIMVQQGCEHIVLKPGQYLVDVFDEKASV
ncbi:MAG: hypothetical protein NT019_00070 [Candidatus Adlerbacteria bacterium]|nr:hypothetical protein [Candidatus Adlerbacteria bacterium]